MPKKILIAEDEWELRNLLKLLLEDYDFDIIEAEEGIQTIELAKTQKPDLIMLDNSMPGFPGYELVPRIKAMPEIANIPIVLVTSKKIEDEMQSMIQIEVVDVLSKPYEEEKVISSLKKVFGTVPKKSFTPSTKFSDMEKTVVLSPDELPFERPHVSKTPPEPPEIEPRFTISKSTDIEKTVVLPQEELPSIKIQPQAPAEIPPVKTSGIDSDIELEKTVVLPQEELPAKEVQPPPEPPETNFEEEKTVILPPEELSFAKPSQPPTTQPPEQLHISKPHGSEPPVLQPSSPVEEFVKPLFSETPVQQPVSQQTKYYTVSGISIKKFLGCIFNIPFEEKSQKDISFLVIAYGSEIVPEELFNMLDIFVGSVVTVDYDIFYDKINELISLGANVFEVNPSAFKKL